MISSSKMNKQPILFLDSGLGSLPYAYFFHTRNEHERVVCVADRGNFPYGPKSRETLRELLDSLLKKLISLYEPKMLVIACNTASISAIDFLREKNPDLPIIGTVPAVKPAVIASKTRKVAVIGTERTIKESVIWELAKRYGPDCEILGTAAPELVEFVEHRLWCSTPEERFDVVNSYMGKFHSAGVDSVVLACTHFLLLKEDFVRAAAGKEMGIFDSVEGVARRVESLLDEEDGKLRSPSTGAVIAPLIVITGDGKPEPYWDHLAGRFGFSFAVISDTDAVKG